MGRLVLFKECEHTFRFSHRGKDTQTLICRSAGQMVLEWGQLLPRLPLLKVTRDRLPAPAQLTSNRWEGYY